MLSGVYNVPVLGGDERLLLANAGFPEALPDGSLLVTRTNSERRQQFYRLWPETGRLQDLPLLASGAGASNLATQRTVPGGKEAIVFGTPIGKGDPRPGLFAVDLASNSLRRLAPATYHDEALGNFAVSRDGKSILAAIPADTMVRLASISTSGRFQERTLFTTTSDVWYLDGGPDGSVYTDLVDRPADVIRLSAGGGSPEKIASFPRVADLDLILAIPDGRLVVPVRAAGHVRLMVVEKGKDPAPLVNTTEETAAPMTIVGAREIAFVIGPSPHQTIAMAEVESGRVIRRIAPGKGVIDSLTSSPDGQTLYFAAHGAIWAVASSGGEAKKICAGDSAVMEPAGASLVVQRMEPARIRLFHVKQEGGPELEIPIDRSLPLITFPLSPSAMDAKGRLLVSLLPRDSWFNPIAILDTATGRITRVPADELSDHQSAAWTPDGHIVTLQLGLRATLWRFTPGGK